MQPLASNCDLLTWIEEWISAKASETEVAVAVAEAVELAVATT